MDLTRLGELMVKYGVVIRAIPLGGISIQEARHADKFPNGTVEYDPKFKREMLKVPYTNSLGGKFMITREIRTSEDIVHNPWRLDCQDLPLGSEAKPIIYDSLEGALEALDNFDKGREKECLKE